jgi:hypothetical protein
MMGVPSPTSPAPGFEQTSNQEHDQEDEPNPKAQAKKRKAHPWHEGLASEPAKVGYCREGLAQRATLQKGANLVALRPANPVKHYSTYDQCCDQQQGKNEPHKKTFSFHFKSPMY